MEIAPVPGHRSPGGSKTRPVAPRRLPSLQVRRQKRSEINLISCAISSWRHGRRRSPHLPHRPSPSRRRSYPSGRIRSESARALMDPKVHYSGCYTAALAPPSCLIIRNNYAYMRRFSPARRARPSRAYCRLRFAAIQCTRACVADAFALNGRRSPRVRISARFNVAARKARSDQRDLVIRLTATRRGRSAKRASHRASK